MLYCEFSCTQNASGVPTWNPLGLIICERELGRYPQRSLYTKCPSIIVPAWELRKSVHKLDNGTVGKIIKLPTSDIRRISFVVSLSTGVLLHSLQSTVRVPYGRETQSIRSKAYHSVVSTRESSKTVNRSLYYSSLIKFRFSVEYFGVEVVILSSHIYSSHLVQCWWIVNLFDG